MKSRLFIALIFVAGVLTASAEVDVNVTDFGAVANDQVDDVAGIQAALNFAATNGGGVVRFPAGRFRIGSRVTVPDKVDLQGAGMTATSITCTANASCVAFGDRQPHATVPRGGKSGHFFLNGNNNAANPLYVGHQQGRTFERIRVLNAADVGLKIEEAQGSRFFAVQVAQSANVNVTIDLSSSVLGFYDCIFSGAGQHGVRILQSGVPANASGAQCSQIRFLGGLIEAIANGGAAIFIEAGTDIVIDGTGTSGADVRIARAANRVVQRITLRAAELQAANSGVRQNVGLEVTGGSATDPIQVFLESGVFFRGGDFPIVTDDGAMIHALNYYQTPGLTNLWRNLGGTKTIDQVVRDLGKRGSALTPVAGSTVDSTYGAEKSAMIENARIRINELEFRLKRAGILGSLSSGSSGSTETTKLINLSTRLATGTGDNVLIAGFAIRGGAKKVAIRALGPSLTAFGVPSVLADPTLDLKDSAGATIMLNNNWQDVPLQAQELTAASLAPGDARESALIVTLPEGNYTVIVRGAGGVTGNCIAEVFDLESMQPAKLVNISTRGPVGTGDSVMIAGFVISGSQPKRVLVRAGGPSLAAFGVPGTLADTTVEVFAGAVTAGSNDDWQSAQAVELAASGLAPSDPREAAIVLTLSPGTYTAVVRGKNATSGSAIIEVYELP